MSHSAEFHADVAVAAEFHADVAVAGERRRAVGNDGDGDGDGSGERWVAPRPDQQSQAVKAALLNPVQALKME